LSFLLGLCGLVLFVADLLHPFDDLAIEILLNGDMRYRRGRRGAMPMLFIRWAPDDVARSNLDFWTAFALYPSTGKILGWPEGCEPFLLSSIFWIPPLK
jgi:hypothetical protein